MNKTKDLNFFLLDLVLDYNFNTISSMNDLDFWMKLAETLGSLIL